MRPAHVLLLALIVPVVLAGCAGEPDADGTPPAAADGAPVEATGNDGFGAADLGPASASEAVAFASCRQFHTSFSAQAADLQPRMPRGFTVATDEAGLAQLAVIATACTQGPQGTAVGMLWVQVAATPPEELAVANASSSVAIEAYLGDPILVQWAHGHGLALAEACTCIDEPSPAPGLLLDAFASDGAEDDYRLQTVLVPDSGPFAGGESHLYVADGGEAVARLRAVAEPSANRGLGTVALTYAGPGGAPPAFAGIAHVIEGLAFTWAVDALGAA